MTTATPARPRTRRFASLGLRPRSLPSRTGRVPEGLVFALPFLIFYALFLLWPVASGLYSSLFNTSLSGAAGEFVGLDNWGELLGDDAVWASLWNTVYFTLLSTPPLVILGLAMALLTNRVMPLRWLWRLAYFAPFLLPVGVVTLIWRFVLQPDFGFLNDLLGNVGVGPVGWLTDPDVSMFSVVMVTVWWTVGFNFLLYLAALQAIPREIYDAAAIDGAGWWRRLWRVELPMLKRATGVVIVLQVLASLKLFDQAYLLNFGGPDHANRPVLQYVFERGFTGFRTGYASAVSYFFLALVVIATIAQFRLLRPAEDAR